MSSPTGYRPPVATARAAGTPLHPRPGVLIVGARSALWVDLADAYALADTVVDLAEQLEQNAQSPHRREPGPYRPRTAPEETPQP